MTTRVDPTSSDLESGHSTCFVTTDDYSKTSYSSSQASSDISITEFNDTCPLYACKNAYDTDHVCKYIECSKWYVLPTRSQQSAKNKNQEINVTIAHNTFNLGLMLHISSHYRNSTLMMSRLNAVGLTARDRHS